MSAMSIYVRARVEPHDGRAAEFEQLANTLRERAGDEPGTLTYRWFTAGPGAYVVLEEYVDAAAAVAHNEGAAELLTLVAACADIVTAELYGPVGPELTAWARDRPGFTVHPELPRGRTPPNAGSGPG